MLNVSIIFAKIIFAKYRIIFADVALATVLFSVTNISNIAAFCAPKKYVN